MSEYLTPAEHEHSAALDLAAEWLAERLRSQKLTFPVISELCFRFGLTTEQACAVAAEAYNSRGRR